MCRNAQYAITDFATHALPRPALMVTGTCRARVLLSVLTWLVSPIVLGCLVVLLVFWLIVVQGQRLRFKREKSKLRIEFDSYRREMQVKARCPGAGLCFWRCAMRRADLVCKGSFPRHYRIIQGMLTRCQRALSDRGNVCVLCAQHLLVAPGAGSACAARIPQPARRSRAAQCWVQRRAPRAGGAGAARQDGRVWRADAREHRAHPSVAPGHAADPPDPAAGSGRRVHAAGQPHGRRIRRAAAAAVRGGALAGPCARRRRAEPPGAGPALGFWRGGCPDAARACEAPRLERQPDAAAGTVLRIRCLIRMLNLRALRSLGSFAFPQNAGCCLRGMSALQRRAAVPAAFGCHARNLDIRVRQRSSCMRCNPNIMGSAVT